MLIPWNVASSGRDDLRHDRHGDVSLHDLLPVIEPDPEQLKNRGRKRKRRRCGSVLAADMLLRFGPVLLAVAATCWSRWDSTIGLEGQNHRRL